VCCLARPDQGTTALAALDIDVLLTNSRLRRAALHLRDHLRAPLAELPTDDEELARTIVDLESGVVRAGHVGVEHLEHERLVLERRRVEREMRIARTEGRPGVGALALQREQITAEIHAIGTKLQLLE
jgi:hypothetical protein